jgi:hypothetical protein
MPLVVGIDEAGYGPLLGPLVVGASVWQVEPRAVAADFWQRLDDVVCRKPGRREWRLAIDDSKRIFHQKRDLAALERPVLACAHASGLATDSLAAFIDALGGLCPGQADPPPWYRDLRRPLPLDPERSAFSAIAERLQRAMEAAGVRCTALLAEVLPESVFNERVAQTRNKAAVLLELVLRLISRATAHAGDQDVYVFVDRLGGRQDYRGLLLPAFPGRHLHVLAAGEESSRYRLATQRTDWLVEFGVDADQRHLPVALASMLAKYVREALMRQFNAFWQILRPTLAPTAGYYQDAQRFLRDLKPVLAQANLPTARFVRQR